MKFQYISDLHGIAKIPTAAENLIIAGDLVNPRSDEFRKFLEVQAKNFRSVIFVPGNHEYYGNNLEDTDVHMQHICNQLGVYFLQCKSILIDDTYILGTTLWSETDPSIEFYLNDYRRITHSPQNLRFTWDKSLELYRGNCWWLDDEIHKHQDDKLVVVTHHLPSYDLIHPIYQQYSYMNQGFASHADHLIRPPVKTWVFGHSHACVDKVINNVRCVSNTRGYTYEHIDGFDLSKTFEV